jgi:hypothetical protein
VVPLGACQPPCRTQSVSRWSVGCSGVARDERPGLSLLGPSYGTWQCRGITFAGRLGPRFEAEIGAAPTSPEEGKGLDTTPDPQAARPLR